VGNWLRFAGCPGFSREIVAEMNRVGIYVHPSHVGSKTSEEAASNRKPAC
jgi:microsomal dipeptidase-like Zn-dependent dipeptidase